MTLTANGTSREVDDGSTVADLLRLLGLEASRATVQRNGRIVPRPEFDQAELAAADHVEIVTFVGGG